MTFHILCRTFSLKNLENTPRSHITHGFQVINLTFNTGCTLQLFFQSINQKQSGDLPIMRHVSHMYLDLYFSLTNQWYSALKKCLVWPKTIETDQNKTHFRSRKVYLWKIGRWGWAVTTLMLADMPVHTLLVFTTCLPSVTFHSPVHTDPNWTGGRPDENRHRPRLLFLGPWTDLSNNRTDLGNNCMDLILFIQIIQTVQKQIWLHELAKTTNDCL